MSATPAKTAEELEALQNAIVEVARLGRALQGSRLKDRTITLLLHDITGLPMRDIRLVLDALPHLEVTYLKPVKATSPGASAGKRS